MDLSNTITGPDYMRLQTQVEGYNKGLQEGRGAKNVLDKDDFLKILITQLSHQDPSQPMEDREFVAQMAQFSSLEQMTNLNKEFSKVANLLSANGALGLLGRNVEIQTGENTVKGIVSEVTGGEFPQILVDGRYYDYGSVLRVKQ